MGAVRDKNLKTRQTVLKLLNHIGRKLVEIEHLEAFISMILAGLATHSSLMKADAIATVATLIDTFPMTATYLDEVTSIVLLMLREKNNEIYKSVITYFKHLAKA